MPGTTTQTVAVASEMVGQFLDWIDRAGMETFDWWDLWSTRIGRQTKWLFGKSRVLGALPVGGLLALDMVYPGSRALFARPRLQPISVAHVGLAAVNLFCATGRPEHLLRAKSCLSTLLSMPSIAPSGRGWGIDLLWTTLDGFIPPHTPCHTQTSYVYELAVALDALEGHPGNDDLRIGILRHESSDFPEWRAGGRLAASYSLADRRRVVNANSYRMYVLLHGGFHHRNDEWTEKGLATLRYVLAMQSDEGSWPYSEEEDFVDTYHTCFVLKNLRKCLPYAGDHVDKVNSALRKGVAFFRDHLLGEGPAPRPFARAPRWTLHRYDSYDAAETVGLLTHENDQEKLNRLVMFIRDRFLTQEGWFRFRLYPYRPITEIPYIRHANSAMLLALSEVIRLSRKGGSASCAE